MWPTRKKSKISCHKQGKNREEKKERVWMTPFFLATLSAFSCYIQCILVLHSVYSTVKRHSWARQQRGGSILLALAVTVLCWDSPQSTKQRKGGTRGSILLALVNWRAVSWSLCVNVTSSWLFFSIYFFSVCSKPKKDGDFSLIS